jgi:hypothetical protein
MTNTIRTFLLAGALLSVAAAANAQGTAEQEAACIGDAFRFCAADIPDAKRIEACLEGNKKKLTSACRAQFDDPPKKPRPRARPASPADRDR